MDKCDYIESILANKTIEEKQRTVDTLQIIHLVSKNEIFYFLKYFHHMINYYTYAL